MPSSSKIQPVILSGGSGTRLWPFSRDEHPKQLLALTHDLTMLQLTVQRVHDDERFAAPTIVASARHAEAIEQQLGAIGVTAGSLILEPSARNTAPAIALAALAAAPETPLLVMPSDHVIRDTDGFLASVERALPAVEEGWLVTFGIHPQHPETGYGYIRRGDAIRNGVHQVDSFVEKPDFATAQAYLKSGDYLWNGGIFLFRAGDYVQALVAYAPQVLAGAHAALVAAEHEGKLVRPDAEAFAASPSISIDYAVMEKAERVGVVPVDIGWSDIGSWDSLHHFSTKDDKGNALSGNVLALDTEGCLVRAAGLSVATIGVKDLIVLAMGDVVVVMNRGDSQRVKEVVEELKRRAEPAPSPR